ncbi:MAG: fumarylacetoacetate hydrolase family protein [Magnetococcales bacterium]|nr:fumarylacetoacetate hydrolase family protein [Magnetococcales bacterium]
MKSYAHRWLSGEKVPWRPGKVVCVGRNYVAHIRELDNAVPEEPVLFLKPSCAMVSLKRPLVWPPGQGACHHEVELALLIGRKLCRATAASALKAVAGYGVGLDLTLRERQDRLKKAALPWETAKAFDASAPLTPFVPASRIDDPLALRFGLAVNGDRRQEGHPGLMLTPMGELLAFASRYFTLLPGDVFLTGTPAGVAALAPGDRLELWLDGGADPPWRYTGEVGSADQSPP